MPEGNLSCSYSVSFVVSHNKVASGGIKWFECYKNHLLSSLSFFFFHRGGNGDRSRAADYSKNSENCKPDVETHGNDCGLLGLNFCTVVVSFAGEGKRVICHSTYLPTIRSINPALVKNIRTPVKADRAEL